MSERDRWGLGRLRETLIRGTAGIDVAGGGLSARIGNVPLFQRGSDGGLRQAVRLWITSDVERPAVTCSLLKGETVLDRVTAAVGPAPTSLHLLAPEVESPEVFQIAIAGGTGDPLRADVTVSPQRKWTVFAIHHSHLDIGYTDPQADVLHHQLAYLDATLDLIDASDAWPEPARFRWNVEVTWPLRHWLARRPPSVVDAFVERVKQGRIEVNALPFSMHTEAYSLDELARQLWFADELRERYGIDVVSAMQTDVPGATIGLATLLTNAGIRYLSVAHNYAGRSVPYLVGGQELTRPFYWQAPNGRRLLVWYTDSPHGLAYMEGGFAGLASDYENAVAQLPEYLSALAQRPYPYDTSIRGWSAIPAGVEITKKPYPHDFLHIRVQSAFADNAAPGLAVAEIVRAWNEYWVYPQLRLATNLEFFAEAEARLGDTIATHQGDWTDWWADGIGSGARPLGFNRVAQGAIRSAQTAHVLADALSGEAMPGVWPRVDQVYDDMALFDEHTWGAANPWRDSLDRMDSGSRQWERKAAFAHNAYEQTDALVEAGLQRLAIVGGAPSTANALSSLIVFNPSPWARTDLVRVFIPESRGGQTAGLTVFDPTNQQPIPTVLEEQVHAIHRSRGRFATFLARDVPALGFARFDLITTDDVAGTDALESNAIENEHYRLDYDAMEGSIRRLYDKGEARELVSTTAPHGFNQYVYDRYGTAPGFNHLSSRVTAVDLAFLGSRGTGRYGVFTERSSNAVWDRMTVRLTGEGVEWLETTLTLARGIRRLDISNRVRKIATMEKESVYFAFPFAVAAPKIAYEVTGGIVGPDSPRVPGSAHQMRAIRHWLTVEDAAGAPPIAWATLEAPLVQLGQIYLPYAPFPETIAADRAHPATVYSWALNNIWDTNFPSQQGGEMTFRYAVATGGDDPSELGRQTAVSLTSPLLGVSCAPAGRAGANSLPVRGSALQISGPGVELTHLAPSRRGHDLVAFLHSTAAETVEAQLEFGLLPVTSASIGSFLERDLQPVPVEGNGVRVSIAPGDYVAVALDLR